MFDGMNTPESLPRRRLHLRGEETIGGKEAEQEAIDGEITQEQPQEIQVSPIEQSIQPANPIAWCAPVFHLSMVVFYSLLLYYGGAFLNDNLNIIDPEGRLPAYGGLFKFLTYINQWVQLFYFSVQFVTDTLPNSHLRKIATKFVDIFFTAVAFPLSWFIVLAFWGNYAYDKERLIYPPLDHIPVWYNHFWHTTIGVFVLFEMLLIFHRFPATGFALSLCFIYFAAYIAWVNWIHEQTSFWVYPIVANQTPSTRFFLFSCSIVFNFGVFFMGKFISYLRWGHSTVY